MRCSIRRRTGVVVPVTLTLVLLGALTPAAPAGADGVAAGKTMVVTWDRTGGQPSDDVVVEDVSRDGRFVVFSSWATDLVPNDTNNISDVFVRDRLLGTTERVSISDTEQQAENSKPSYGASISDDGRRVAFASYATNLVTGDTNNGWDIFVRDRFAGTTVRASTGTGGTQINGETQRGEISGGGRYIAFETNVAGVVPGETGTEYDVFVKDLVDDDTELVSETAGGTDGNGDSRRPSISSDGRYVAFDTDATNLGGTDTNNDLDVYLRDRTGDATTRVSVNSAEVQANKLAATPSVSATGRFVAFASFADNLAPGETGDKAGDVFVRDLVLGTTERVSVTSAEVKGNGTSGAPSISADGDRVVFTSYAANLGAPGLDPGVVVRDRSAGTTSLTGANPTGTTGGFNPKISPDGRYIVWDDQFSDDGDGDNGLAYIRVLAGSTFTDVPTSNVFFEAIAWMVDSDITTGYADGTYHPLDDVSRQALCAFLYRFAGEPAFMVPALPTFADVGAGHPFRKEIEWAADEGYVTGFADGTFGPTTDVTRGSMAAILFRVSGNAFVDPATPTFSDVPKSHPFFTEIEWAAASGVTTGYPDGTFRPGETVSRQFMAAFLFRLYLRGG